MAAKRDLEKMSVEELEAESFRLDAEGQKIREQKRAVQDVLGAKNEANEAARKFENMSEPERRALLQHIKGRSIKSAEDVGSPGDE
jgi:hypothetical protein